MLKNFGFCITFKTDFPWNTVNIVKFIVQIVTTPHAYFTYKVEDIHHAIDSQAS